MRPALALARMHVRRRGPILLAALALLILIKFILGSDDTVGDVGLAAGLIGTGLLGIYLGWSSPRAAEGEWAWLLARPQSRRALVVAQLVADVATLAALATLSLLMFSDGNAGSFSQLAVRDVLSNDLRLGANGVVGLVVPALGLYLTAAAVSGFRPGPFSALIALLATGATLLVSVPYLAVQTTAWITDDLRGIPMHGVLKDSGGWLAHEPSFDAPVWLYLAPLGIALGAALLGAGLVAFQGYRNVPLPTPTRTSTRIVVGLAIALGVVAASAKVAVTSSVEPFLRAGDEVIQIRLIHEDGSPVDDDAVWLTSASGAMPVALSNLAGRLLERPAMSRSDQVERGRAWAERERKPDRDLLPLLPLALMLLMLFGRRHGMRTQRGRIAVGGVGLILAFGVLAQEGISCEPDTPNRVGRGAPLPTVATAEGKAASSAEIPEMSVFVGRFQPGPIRICLTQVPANVDALRDDARGETNLRNLSWKRPLPADLPLFCKDIDVADNGGDLQVTAFEVPPPPVYPVP